MQPSNYYEILGIRPEADTKTVEDAISSRIKEKQLLAHSLDRNVWQKAEEELKLLLEARKVLLDPARRKQYNIAGKFNAETVNYAFNPSNLLTEIAIDTQKISFEYNAAGDLTKIIFPNSIEASRGYDKAGRVCALNVTDTKGAEMFSFSYRFDAVGNCLVIERKSSNSRKRTIYAYDRLYRLIKVKATKEMGVKYAYSANGDRLSEKIFRDVEIFGKTAHYLYDKDNRLIKAGAAEFKYDNNGNLIERVDGGKITKFFYSPDGKLVKIEYPDKTFSAYTYDNSGNRTAIRKPDGTSIYYLYNGNRLACELNDKKQVAANYVYGPGINYPIYLNREGKRYYYICDNLGSVVALLDAAGAVAAEYEYDAWGNTIKETGSVVNPFRFKGMEWDMESGFYYCRTRYYDPKIGRFISKDHLSGNPANPQTFNKYSYACNNPLKGNI